MEPIWNRTVTDQHGIITLYAGYLQANLPFQPPLLPHQRSGIVPHGGVVAPLGRNGSGKATSMPARRSY